MKALKRDSLERYFGSILKGCKLIEFKPLGRGVHGRGFLISLKTKEGIKNYVLKGILPEGLGHDYPSDRAGMLLLALNNYGRLLKHVKALDVLSLGKKGILKSIGGGKEYFLLMEQAEGTSYFKDLKEFSKKKCLDEEDKKKILLMAEYLRKIHSVKKRSRTLYLRKLRDIIGHGECLMGVFDTYPDGVLSCKRMAEIEKKCIDWRARLKDRWRRLSQIHGDFHPGNIWWANHKDFVLLDRSRGEWGEPADDITALAINYIFFSIKHFNAIKGAYLEGFRLFFEKYISLTGDSEILDVLALFFAFRGAVVANPVFYPELTQKQRRLLFRFVINVLDSKRFIPDKVQCYLKL
ncbi:MAG: phosphotransferase [Nitrospirae bacterium]|nr:phosphotransferase [Nitrospirota bacterium]